MAAGSSVVTYIAQQKGGAMDPGYRPLSLRLGNAIWSYGRYIAKTLWPAIWRRFTRITGRPRDRISVEQSRRRRACLLAITLARAVALAPPR
jgi:hypothetical protein